MEERVQESGGGLKDRECGRRGGMQTAFREVDDDYQQVASTETFDLCKVVRHMHRNVGVNDTPAYIHLYYELHTCVVDISG